MAEIQTHALPMGAHATAQMSLINSKGREPIADLVAAAAVVETHGRDEYQ